MPNTSKSVLITGGSAGIGEACVKKFAAQGYQVFNLDQHAPRATIHNVEYIACDLSDTGQIQQAIKQIATVDVVVSAAGQHFSGTIEDTSEADFDNIIDVNLKGTFFLLKQVLPLMKKQKKGSIVLLGSDQSIVGKTHSAVYGITKAAIAQLAKSTALDYAAFNIRVNAICPGTIDTPMYRHAIQRYHDKTHIPLATIEDEEARMQPVHRIGTPAEVAEFIYFVASDAAPFITGSLLSIDGGYTAR